MTITYINKVENNNNVYKVENDNIMYKFENDNNMYRSKLIITCIWSEM